MSAQPPDPIPTALLDALRAYLPRDRRQALAHGVTLLDRTAGTALFADISGFTPLTHRLVQAHGPRRGVEELVGHLNRVYDALIGAVDDYGGTVIGFAGDAITCWFESPESEVRGPKSSDSPAPDTELPDSRTPRLPDSGLRTSDSSHRAAACALAMQRSMASFASAEGPVRLALKVALATGPARRFVAGDPEHKVFDVLAGATLARMAAGERLAGQGEILADEATVAALGPALRVSAWRSAPDAAATEPRFAVVAGLDAEVARAPWQPLPSGALGADQLRPWLVPAVYARLSSGQGEFLTELRPAVALFLSFEGIDYDGDEGAGAKLDAYVRWVQHVLARYAGTLIQLTIGDKGSYLYAAFGAPYAHEDDTGRALRAALDLCTPPVALDCIHAVRIGIAQGTGRAGAYGGATRRTYGVLGDNTNLAARLMQSAVPGQILVTLEARAQTGDEFAWRSLPPLMLKGLAHPIFVYELTGSVARRELRLQEPRYALAMVGRQEELRRSEELLAEIKATGRGHVIGICAEAGMGKSRLAAEVIARARALDYQAFGGSAVSYGMTTPYLAWRSIVRGLLDLPDEGSPAAQQELIEHHLERNAPELRTRLPLLGDALGLDLPDNEFTAGLDAGARRQSVCALIADLIRMQAAAGPVLLVLEDAHWLDDLSRQMARYLPGFIADRPVCFLSLYRPAQAAGGEALWSPPPQAFTEFALAPFSAAESAALVQLKLGSRTAPQALLEQVAARAQGNPFFVDEFVNLVQARGLELAGEALELPDSLERLILSRLDQLAEDERLLLRVASVIGRLFRARWLFAIYPAQLQQEVVRASLARLHTTELVALNAEDPELEYLFKHAITQEAAYATLSLATRRMLHERLAEYLAEVYAANLPAWFGILAYHYQRAERPERELVYTRLAAGQAARQSANRQALALYERALALAETVALPAAGRFELHAGRFDQLNLLGEYARLREDLPALQALAGELGPAEQVQALLRQGTVEERLIDGVAAMRTYERAAELAAAHDDQAGWLDAMSRYGYAYFGAGDYVAGKRVLQDIIARAGEEHWQSSARAAQVLGWIVYDEGDYAHCGRLWQYALNVYQGHADKPGEALLLSNLAALYGTLFELARAVDFAERGLAIAVQLGYKPREREALRTLGEIWHWSGQFARAEELLARALALADAMEGDIFGQTYVRSCLAEVALETGDLARAETWSRTALETARKHEGRDTLGHILHTRGRVVLRRDALGDARVLLEECLAVRRDLKEVEKLLPTLADLGEVYRLKQDWPAARSAVAQMRDLLFPAEGQAREDVAACLTGYRILTALGETAEARAWLDLAQATLHQNVERIDDEALRASYLANVGVHRAVAEEHARAQRN